MNESSSIQQADILWKIACWLAARCWTPVEAHRLVKSPEWPQTSLPDYPEGDETDVIVREFLDPLELSYCESERACRIFAKTFRWAIEQHAFGNSERCRLHIHRQGNEVFVGLLVPIEASPTAPQPTLGNTS